MSRFPPNSRPPQRFDPRKPQAIADLLGRTDAFRALRAGVEQMAAMQRDLSTLLPDYLASSVEPGFIKEGVLTLFAGHNALAARLRHIEPRLLADLQQRGWAVNSLKIRVRPQSMKEAAPSKTGAHVRGRRRCVAGTRAKRSNLRRFKRRLPKWPRAITRKHTKKNERRFRCRSFFR